MWILLPWISCLSGDVTCPTDHSRLSFDRRRRGVERVWVRGKEPGRSNRCPSTVLRGGPLVPLRVTMPTIGAGAGCVRKVQERGEPHPDPIARKGVAIVLVIAAYDHQARGLQLSERVGRLQRGELEGLRDLVQCAIPAHEEIGHLEPLRVSECSEGARLASQLGGGAT